MKKIITIAAVCALCMTLATPTFAAYNYDFGSGLDSGSTFGKPTSNDDPITPAPMSQNTRRNKDNSALPPPYFYGSGDIPTDSSSLYHDNTPDGAGSGYGGTGSGDYAGSYGGGTGNNTNSGGSNVNISLPEAPGLQASTSTVAAYTEPLYYDNGSIGTIYVARTNKAANELIRRGVIQGDGCNLQIGAAFNNGTTAVMLARLGGAIPELPAEAYPEKTAFVALEPKKEDDTEADTAENEDKTE